MHCKSLWIKASAKCINVNVNIKSNYNYKLKLYKYYIHTFKKMEKLNKITFCHGKMAYNNISKNKAKNISKY